MYKSNFNHITTCKICNKNFMAHNKKMYSKGYCNACKKNKSFKKSSVRPKRETWQSVLKEDFNPPEFGLRISYGMNRN